MLLPADKLNWWMLDLHSRNRRRILVVLTYALFLGAVWGRSARVYDLTTATFWPSLLLQNLDVLDIVHDLGAGMRIAVRAVVFSLVAAFVVLAFRPHHHPANDYLSPAYFAFIWLILFSPLAPSKLVDSGNRGWIAQAIRKGPTLGRFAQRRLARHGYAAGLEGYARYEYGEPFRRLSPAQKIEIQERVNAHPRGEWKRDRTVALFDDERLRQEEAQLRARVQRTVSTVLVLAALALTLAGLADDFTLRSRIVISAAWTLAALATTLRQTLVLWTEHDPRVTVGEIELVEQAHA